MTVRVFYYFFSYFMVSVVLALTFVPLMRPVSVRLGAVDRGTGRRVHHGVVPRLGGIGIALAFFLPVAFWLTRGQWDGFQDSMSGILIGSGIVFFTGLYDDIRRCRVRTKLLLEALAAVVVYAWGVRITIVTSPVGTHLHLGVLSLPATVLWIIIITNAINLIDGLDGLAAGTGIAVAALFFALSGGDLHLQMVYVIFAGSLLGFLRYNFPPASIFMGDSGSLFVGFFLACLSVLSSHKAAAMAVMMVPLVAFSLPLMDMLYAVLRRYYRGVALGSADREHIHHKLLEKGLTKKKALFILYSLNICLMLLALLLVTRQLRFNFLGLVAVAVVAVAGLRLLGYLEFQPFIREMLRKHSIGKQRRYCDYVVSRFRKDAAKSRSFEDLRAPLSRLLGEYDISSFEVILDVPPVTNPLFVYRDGSDPDGALEVTFPVVSGPSRIGEVHMRTPMEGYGVMVTADLIRALSEEIGSATAKMEKDRSWEQKVIGDRTKGKKTKDG